ncbi:MAG: cytochrome c family protein [Pseudomonadota bacterium]|nr:cytochrome c family protein [Pseudomonadota bacterium]
MSGRSVGGLRVARLAVLAAALSACAARPDAAPTGAVPVASPVEPLPTDAHRAAEAEAAARVPDPARGGPPLVEGASPLPAFLGVSRAANAYVGTATCAACHPSAYSTWNTSAHAHALETLRVNSSASNPSCLPCHVTGLGHPGGWSGAKTAPLDNVGCEACHGPGGAHVEAPSAGYGDLPQSGAACVACHTHDNSPDFRFERYWPQIAHEREIRFEDRHPAGH